MADIVDPQVIRFVNERVRPIAEDIRDLHALLTDAAADYTANIAGLLSSNVNADPLADGRDAEGISRLTKGDITAWLSVGADLLAVLDAAGVMDDVRKPTVRPLRVG